jgi:hypothetical protein
VVARKPIENNAGQENNAWVVPLVGSFDSSY